MKTAAAANQVAQQPTLKFDLGAGLNPREGFTGVDIVALPNSVQVDLKQDWPWANGSVEELHCSHFIEHITGDEQIHFMNEAWRVLKLDAKITIITPYWNSVRFHQDPTHKKAFTDNTAFYFVRAWREANKLTHYPITGNFDFTVSYSFSDPRWVNAEESARNFAIKHYANVVDDLILVFTKRE